MERFITNKDNNIVFNPNFPSFVYYFNDEHIYLINDKQMRHSLLIIIVLNLILFHYYPKNEK